MKIMTLHTEYVSEQEDVKSLFLNTTKNLYIKKGSTGIGGTSVLLEATEGIKIIVSPTIGMIQGKENKNKRSNVYFIYGGSKDKWENFLTDPNENKIVNCTPEQILSLKNKSKLSLINNHTIFVDEIHQYIPDASYRDGMKIFMDIIFNQWKGNWILSSATDNQYDNILLDVPPGIEYEVYIIVKPNIKPKAIEVLRGPKPSNYKEVLMNTLSNSKKLLIATNDSSLHKRFIKIGIDEKRIINLVGDNIQTKIRSYKTADDTKNINWEDVDVILISSKYFAGFDIPVDVDILIDTNPHKLSNMIGINDIRQIIGRCRTDVGRILIFISYSKPITEKASFISEYEDSSLIPSELKKRVLLLTADNWFDETQQIIKENIYFSLLNASSLKYELSRYNYVSTSYKSSIIKTIPNIKWPFEKQLTQLVSEDIGIINNDFLRICKLLKYKMDGNFSGNEALLFYSAILIKKYKLNITDKQPSRFYPKLDNLLKKKGIKEYKWDILFGWYKTVLCIKNVKNLPLNAKYSKVHLDYLEIRSLPTLDLLNSAIGIQGLYDDCIKKLNDMNIIAEKKETDKLWDRCKDAINSKEWKGHRTRESILENIGYAHLLLLNGERENYNFPLNKNRQYNPLTMIPSCLRGLINTPLIEIDITSANPTFIDMILGSNLKNEVYSNIMIKYNIDRNQAKKRYNTFLNNDNADPNDVCRFFQGAGYSYEDAIKITQMVVERKGYIYEKMTEAELNAIKQIQNYLLIHDINKTFRFHDALLILKGDRKYFKLNAIETYINSKYPFNIHIKSYNTDLHYEEPDLVFTDSEKDYLDLFFNGFLNQESQCL